MQMPFLLCPVIYYPELLEKPDLEKILLEKQLELMLAQEFPIVTVPIIT